MIIPYQQYRFIIEAKTALSLPPYKGSTFRGGFGSAFRKVVCALRRNDCADCMLREKCVYAYIFETPPPEGTTFLGMGKYQKIPHPFIIEPPADTRTGFAEGERLEFGLVLVGKATEYFPYFVYTFSELGDIGIGRGRGRYSIVSASSGKTEVYSGAEKLLKKIPPASFTINNTGDSPISEMTVTISFKTPARIRFHRDLATELPFFVFITNLLRRINALSAFHCSLSGQTLEPAGLIEKAKTVEIQRSDLSWWDWERYSSRQNSRMMMGGLVGTIAYKGNISPFLPILQAGEIFHVGKGTSFGLGEYSIDCNENKTNDDAL